MVSSKRGRPGRWASVAVAAVALSAVIAWAAPAFAVTIDVGGTVFESKCTYCHATIAESAPGAEIKFSHAYHLTYNCSACHTKFPHAQGATALPKMIDCFSCHRLRHGPQGILAKGDCMVCHNTPRPGHPPTKASMSAPEHTADWALTPHVEPGRKELRTRCMMCHEQKWCDDCHVAKGIYWKPAESFTFDSQQSCQVCHGQENLAKSTAAGLKSFQVIGVQDSAHAKLSCTSCHTDFKYVDNAIQPDATKLWEVNAGLGCRACHEGKVPGYEKATEQFAKVVKEYENSIHAQKLFKENNLDSATCSSCHGGHNIQRLNTDVAKAAFHGTAYQVCARCHLAKYESYNDYYHGAAYKRGAPDAPACWNCHGSHAILKSTDKDSMMSPEKMAKTCASNGKCHAGSEESFASGAKSMIHQKAQVQASNPLQQLIAKIKSWFS